MLYITENMIINKEENNKKTNESNNNKKTNESNNNKLAKKLKLAILDAVVVGGISFFSVLASKGAAAIIQNSELVLLSALISFALSFLISFRKSIENVKNL